jgi:hypothetical protein
MNTRLILTKVKPIRDDRFILHSKVEVTDSNTYARADINGFPVSFGVDATQVVKDWADANGYNVHDANTKNWKVIVTTTAGEAWSTNAKVYPTWEEAQDGLYDLTSRWYAVKHGAIRPATPEEVAKWEEMYAPKETSDNV